MVADILAKKSWDAPGLHYSDSPPPSVISILLDDMIAFTTVRKLSVFPVFWHVTKKSIEVLKLYGCGCGALVLRSELFNSSLLT
ncbi:hypothetical protein M0R45_020891 [Rubus argutus]|uniref:Uncharacterized protein n=1 Tax=Rubus argutus TaxID=59490 RepID=A0AAW1XBW1_RUBAR